MSTQPELAPDPETVKPSVLVVEDQPDIAKSIKRLLSPYYEIYLAENVPVALTLLGRLNCSLVLLDIMLPQISGYWLCQKIKSDVSLRHIPVIFLTGMADQQDVINGFKIGADDYVQKPFKADELLARTHATIRRTSETLNANPLSRLPGNTVIENDIVNRIQSNEIFSVLYLDINHFKAYNDYYGFHRGDNVIRDTSRLLLQHSNRPGRSLGHVGGDDFILMCGDEDPVPLCEDIIKEFDVLRSSFYDEKDLKAGCIKTTNRQGQIEQFSLLSIAVGVVTNRHRPLQSLGEVATVGAEVKSVAKRQKGSSYFIDSRKPE